MSESSKLAYSPREAWQALGIKKTSFYKLVREGQIETFSYFGAQYVRADVLQAHLDKVSGRIAA